MTTNTSNKAESYRIGAVSRLTGLSADNLRVWEKRYQAVTPARIKAGGRSYSANDVRRLKLMKSLIDHGDTISAIATLDEAQLKARLQQSQVMSESVTAKQAGQHSSRVVIVGETLSISLPKALNKLSSLKLVACFDNNSEFQSQLGKLKADTLIIEQQTLHVDTAIQINDWMNRLAAHKVIVIYRFASRDALKRLPASKYVCLRAPVSPQTIQQQCMHQASELQVLPFDDMDPSLFEHTTPGRRFDDETLTRIADVTSSIKCECPRHLAELISSLAAFEQYSSECESRNDRDAAVHDYLNKSTARARYIIETALQKLIEIDNIKV